MKRTVITILVFLVVTSVAFGVPWRELIYDPEVDSARPVQVAEKVTPPGIASPGAMWTEASVAEKRMLARFVVASLQAAERGRLDSDVWEVPVQSELDRLYTIPENWNVPLDGMIYYIVYEVIPNREGHSPYGAPAAPR